MFSVWDPRGLLLPFSIRSKIILQNLNRLKYGWGDELKEADLREWREWFKESELLETVQIPRALFSWNEPFRETNLDVFCDVSQDAYGAFASLRREFEDNVVECRLVAGKGRVAPLEPVLGWKRYSSLAELRRVLAHVMRFVNNTRVNKELRQSGSRVRTPLVHENSRTFQDHIYKNPGSGIDRKTETV